MQVVTKTIEVLEDGKLKAIDSRNKTVYIQPIIVVDRLSETITVSGSDDEKVDTDTTITSIDGVTFSGDFDALEVALRNMAAKANGILNAGGGTGSDVSKETKQDDQLEQDRLKEIGLVIDLTADENSDWPGFPLLPQSSPTFEIVFTNEDGPVEIDAIDLEIEDNVQLAAYLNVWQPFWYFEAAKGEAEKLIIKEGTRNLADLESFQIDEQNSGNPLIYLESDMTATADSANSNTDQILLEQQAIKQGVNQSNIYLEETAAGVKKGASSSTSQVPSSVTAVTLKPFNPNRVSLKIFNSGANVLFIKEGAIATLSDYTYKLDAANASLLPFVKISDYTGIVTGIWDVASGDAKVTETV